MPANRVQPTVKVYIHKQCKTINETQQGLFHPPSAKPSDVICMMDTNHTIQVTLDFLVPWPKWCEEHTKRTTRAEAIIKKNSNRVNSS